MILMLAPGPNMAFGAMPSGASYVSDANSLVQITNNSAADQVALQGAGCWTLTPCGGWGTFSFDTMADLYAADLASSLVIVGQVGFPKFSTCQVMSDPTPENNGTWYKSGDGNGSGNWSYIAVIASSGAVAAQASAAQAGASATQALNAQGTATSQSEIAVAAAGAAQGSATSAQTALTAILAAIAAGAIKVFPTTAAALSNGVIGYTFVAGSGGTNGSYPLAYSGGSGSNAAATILVAGGAITAVTPQSPGSAYTSAPTCSFTVTGLTGASVTATIGANTTNGTIFAVPVAATGGLSLYQNQSGAAVLLFTLGGTVNDSASFSQSGYQRVEFGADGNLLWGILSGSYPGFAVDGIVEQNPVRYPKTQLNLGGSLLAYTGGTGWSQSGKSWCVMGSDGSDLGGIDDAAFPQPTGAFSPFRNARSEYLANSATGWELFTRRDSSNYMQVWSRNVSLGIPAVQLSSAGADHINPHFDLTGTRAVWSTSNKDRWFSNQLRARLLTGAAAVGHAYPSKYLTCAGDSILNGTGATPGNSFAALTAAALGLTTNMRAIGGQQVWQQAMQMGAIPTILTVASTSITTSGVSVSAIATTHPTTGATYSCNVQGMSGVSLYPNTLLLSTPSGANTSLLYGTITDSAGKVWPALLTRTATGTPSTTEAYSLSSQSGATITTTSTTVTFVPSGPNSGQNNTPYLALGDQHNAVMIYEGGINDLSQGVNATNRTPPSASSIMSDVAACQDAIIALNASAVQAFAVVGVYNPAATWAIAGSAADLAIAAYNAARKAKYPGRFVDAFAILAAGNNGSTQDLSDVANHYIPTSEQADPTHPNNTGHGNIANGNSGGAGVISVLTAQVAAIPTS